ncbi:MAG: CocE/NonD family hydrolase [Planctomycetota bacterium]|nr:CocE/NonD family hydrolase [Planctomycetota bacterium]
MRALILTIALFPSLAVAQEKVSAFGEYSGYSAAVYDGWTTESRYVAMRDGVRLAVDITRPTKAGELNTEPVPLVWTHSRYHRNPSALMKLFNPEAEDRKLSSVDVDPGLQNLVRHGYAVASVGVRGSGASFGTFSGLFNEDETKDAAELCAWFAGQEWCDGNIGMFGGSYLGITQYMAASQHPTGLKAIFPDVAAFDLYDLLYPGGVFREDLMRHWDLLTDQLDAEILAPPVDGDEDAKLRTQAIAEHANNWQVLDGYRSAPYRDHRVPGLDWSKHGPAPLLDRINSSGVAIYHTNGWFDVFALDTCLWFVNYAGPQRVIMGDWSHAQMSRQRFSVNAVEQHRWFDRWLKGIENGVDEGPRMQYALHVAPGELEWRSTDQWPPLGVVDVVYAFGAGGKLSTGSVEAGSEGYAIDPDATTGTASRWDNAVGAAPGGMSYSSAVLAERAERALCWTGEPMGRDLVFVGHPQVTLHLEASAGDADLVVVLEELDAQGNAHYLTEGVLRASHHRLSEAPYDNLGLPWQRSFEADAGPLPEGTPTEIRMDLHPLAATIQEGHRLRVSLTCADADNLIAPVAGLGESVTVHYGAAHPSGLVLPVQQAVWIVHGAVKNSSGHPVEGATVRAHCGYGTLRETGRALTDAEGRYTLTFGTGMLSEGSLEQVATISARKPGWFEASLGTQGGLMMAKPKGDEAAREGVVLEGIPYPLDFTLDRGATVEGRLVDADGRPIPSRKLVLAGEELPPSSNVLDVVRTDSDGRFVFEGVPTGRAWWISLRGTHPEEREKAGNFVFEEGRHVLGLVFHGAEGTSVADGQRGELFAYEWPYRPKDVYRPRWRAPEGWVERYAGNRFSLIMPPDWVRKPVRGIDSYVAKFEGPGVSLQLDHGMYSSKLESLANRANHSREDLNLSGFAAALHRCDGFVGLHFPKAGPLDGVGLTLLAACDSDEARDVAEQVLRTLRFPLE